MVLTDKFSSSVASNSNNLARSLVLFKWSQELLDGQIGAENTGLHWTSRKIKRIAEEKQKQMELDNVLLNKKL